MSDKVFQNVTDQIVAALEAGVDGSFELPWVHMKSVAINAKTGRRLVGISQLLCSMSMVEHGFEANKWLTIKQANELGGKIDKGSKSTLVFWLRPFLEVEIDGKKKLISPEGNQLHEAIEAGEPVIWSYRFAPYFNVEQVTGLPDELYEPVNQTLDHGLGNGFEPILEAEAFIQLLQSSADPLKLVHKGNSAFYAPSLDQVVMPQHGKFKSELGYYSTLFHEIGHWTGHQSRNAREGIVNFDRFGSSKYAFEELVAELSASFKMAEMGLEREVRQDHVQYIADWIKILKDDPKAIFKAAQDASRAVRYMNKLIDEYQPSLLSAVA